jgi:glutaredoxin-like YruB-family protein
MGENKESKKSETKIEKKVESKPVIKAEPPPVTKTGATPENKVIVYSAEWCPWCHKAMDFLKEHKVNFEMRDVSKNPEYAKEVVEKSGQTGIPVIVIGKEVITGFNMPAIKKAIGI